MQSTVRPPHFHQSLASPATLAHSRVLSTAALERRILERTVAIHKYLFPNASFPYIEWVPRRTPWPINSNSEANSEKTNTQSYSKSLEASSNPFEDLKVL
ncbi:hypothetical protein U1Q18_041955 [Sarracenia purpurea var. burkii]